MSSISIKTLQDRFLELNLSENQNVKAFRSPFFTDCGKYYQSTHSGNCELIDDQFYQAALKILQRKLFADNPNTYAWLSPSAKNYKTSWKQLIEAFSLKDNGESELELKINTFVRSHVVFTQRLIQAFRSTEEKTPLGVKLNDPITVKTFYQAALEFLIQNPSRFARTKETFEESYSELFDLLYHEVLLKHFQQSHPHQEIPEFFASSEKKIAKLKQQFQELSADDQSKLNCAGLMNLEKTWDSACLSKEGIEFFKALREFIYTSQDGNNRNKFAMLNQIVFFLIATDLNIADQFKSSEALGDLEKPAGEIVDLEDIVSEVKILPKHLEMIKRKKTAVFLKALSEAEYRRLEKANLVPSKNMLKRVTFRRIPKDTQFERIALISALAVSLKKFKGDENPPAALVGN